MFWRSWYSWAAMIFWGLANEAAILVGEQPIRVRRAFKGWQNPVARNVRQRWHVEGRGVRTRRVHHIRQRLLVVGEHGTLLLGLPEYCLLCVTFTRVLRISYKAVFCDRKPEAELDRKRQHRGIRTSRTYTSASTCGVKGDFASLHFTCDCWALSSIF